MIWFLLAHLCAAVAAPFVMRRFGRNGFWGLALVPAATCGWLVSLAPGIAAGRAWTWSMEWIPALGMRLALGSTSSRG